MNKAWFYILNLTWGLPLTLCGALVAFAMLITGHKPHRHGGCIYFAVGNNWGGVELGLFFLTDQRQTMRIRNHEFGHALQNCIWGPLMIFVVSIPSVCWYWYRELKYHRRGITPPNDYDDMWFEGQATRWGTSMIKYWKMK